MIIALGIISTMVGLICAVFGSIFLVNNAGLVALVLFGYTAFILGVVLIFLGRMND